MPTRTEHDSLGPVEVPRDAYWGAQTARSLRHFAIGEERMPIELVHAYALVKRAAAETNAELAGLDPKAARAIAAACDELLAGRWDDQFPLSVWQTGSGTQTNMNVNEVLSARATELLGGDFRVERLVHPNDDVNRSQSSNDTFPTATHVAVYRLVVERTLPALARLREALREKAAAFAGVVKTGRTHLMDATPLTLGQELGGYAAQLDRGREALRASLPRVAELPLGGTAVGTGLNAPPSFGEAAIARIAEATGHPFVPARDRFEALSTQDALVELSGQLRRLAVSLLHVANNVRLLASGPRTGLGELVLPANEPGSSIMPGKVNPTQCEALAMVAAQVVGLDAAVALAGTHGHLQLNVFRPLVARNVLRSAALLADAIASFEEHAVRGLEADRERIEEHLARSLMLVTALAPELGYERAATIARKAHEEGTTLREAALTTGWVDAATFDRLVDPARMV